MVKTVYLISGMNMQRSFSTAPSAPTTAKVFPVFFLKITNIPRMSDAGINKQLPAKRIVMSVDCIYGGREEVEFVM